MSGVGAEGDGPIDTWTVVFTDLVGRTALRVRLGEGAFDRLRTSHDAQVSAVLEQSGAKVVKPLGDGLVAAFTSTSAALSCAVSIQQRLDERNQAAAPISVRVGVSIGEAVIEDGDIQGRAVLEASGLCGVADGGEILCSETVRAVAGSHGPSAFGSSRAVELNGFAEPVLACTVRWTPRPFEAARQGRVFATLGALEVSDASGPVAMGGPKERLVLAVLLARANRVVSLDAIVDAVWGEDPPRTADRTVHAYVARLRSVLEPDRSRRDPHRLLVTEGRGYRLKVTGDQLDSLRFEELAQRGSEQLANGDESAAATLREALALWRGEPFAGHADVEVCAAEARRLREIWLVAVEDRIEADLAGGATGALVAEVDSLVAEHPFRERLWGNLMLALYRAGRQADALAAYQRARQQLVDELGIEPGSDLRQLEAAILAQDSSLDTPRRERRGPGGLPLPLEAVGPAFVGRDRELERLRSAWERAVAGRGGLVSIVGPEGMGKTRLIAELAREAHQGGGVVLYGRCDHSHRGARALLDLALRSAGASLGELDTDGAEGDLAGTVARFLPTWTQGRPVLLALDDLHLADADALEVVAELAEWCLAGPVLVVGAFRSDAEAPRPGDADDGSSHVVLRGLDAAAVGRICELYAPDGWASDEVERLSDLTGGVPLEVHEHASEWARARVARRAEDAAERMTGARARLVASRAEIADSVEVIQRLLEQRRTHLAARATDVEAALDLTILQSCPYKGLAPFEEKDADAFFGRERLVAELAARVPGSRLLAVVGPSGGGKSSLVRAGLLPALAQGVLPGSEQWTVATLAPGAHPMRELQRHVGSGEALQPSLVFVDQFEEAFTLCDDGSERVEFFDRIVQLAMGGTVIVFAIRGDHLEACAAHPDLAALVDGNDVLVGPMRDSELRRAIELPAQRVGLALEPGVVEVIVGDVAGRAGALPLLSTALAETWERRRDGVLTLTGYREAGGVNGALARLADETYLSLHDGARAGARRALLRLADAGDDGTNDLRRRLPLAEVAPPEDLEARVAVEAMVARRLLTVDRDSVEVAHEALLREWPRLRSWLEDDVQGRRLHRRLGESARGWRLTDKDPSELLRGSRLDAALDWATAHESDLSDTERWFLDASAAQAEAERVATERRARQQARTNRRLRGLLAGVAVLLVAALVAGLLAVRQANRADTVADEAERTADEADARRVGAQALVTDDADRSLLLALEGLRRDDSVDTRANLLAAIARNPRLIASARADEPLVALDVSPDGDIVAVSDQSGGVAFHDAGTLDVVGEFDEPASSLEFRPDGAQVALALEDDPHSVLLIDGRTFEREAVQLGGTPDGGVARALRYSADGRFLAVFFDSFSGDPSVAVWDADRPERPVLSVNLDEHYLAVALSPDGRLVYLGSPDEGSPLSAYDVATGELVGSAPIGAEVLDVSPDGTRLAVGDGADIRLVDALTLTETARLRGHTDLGAAPGEEVDVHVVQFSNDGRLLAASEDRTTVLWDVASGDRVLELLGHAGTVFDAGFSPDDGTLYTSGLDRALLAWDVIGDRGFTPRQAALAPDVPEAFVFGSPNGEAVAFADLVSGHSGRPAAIQFADLDRPRLGGVIDTGHVQFGATSWHPIDGERFATAGEDGFVRVWDWRSGELVDERQVADEYITGLDYSRDGRRLVLSQASGTVSAIDAATLKPVGQPVRLDDDIVWAFAGPDGRTGVALTVQGTVALVDLEAGSRLHDTAAGFDPSYAEFSPDGRQVAVAGFTGDVAVLDVGDGEWLRPRVVGHTETIESLSYAPDGRLFVTGGRDGRVALWDAATGAPLGSVIPGRPNVPTFVEFLPDSRTVLISSTDGNVYTWDTILSSWVDLACRVAGRNLTVDEWRESFGEETYRKTCPD